MDLPSVAKYIQEEETDSRGPTSESAIQKIGGSLNWLINNSQGLAVGSVEWTVLTEAQYQGINGVGFVLADGRSVVGSAYNIITGQANIPDLRGYYLRMRDYGAGVNPSGDIAVGSVQTGIVKSHTHPYSLVNPFSAGSYDSVAYKWPGPPFNTRVSATPGVWIDSTLYAAITGTITAIGTGNGEPKRAIGNWIIRIN